MAAGEQDQAGKPGVELRPPGSRAEPLAGKTGTHRLLWGALAIVIMLGLAVVLVLPKLVSETGSGIPAGVPGQIETTALESPPSAAQESANSRSEATQTLQDFLHTRARLELANAPVWGEPQWSRADDGVTRGNVIFGQRQFAMAAEAFSKSL